MMKKLFLISLLLLGFNSCTKEDNSATTDAPVISFYKGIDPWTHQPTFIYSDTIISGMKERMVKVNFAAAGVIRHLFVSNNGEILIDKEVDNDTKFNEEFSIVLSPESLPKNYKILCRVKDYNDKTTERELDVTFQ